MLATAASPGWAAVEFKPPVAWRLSGSEPRAVVIGDLNNDHHLDWGVAGAADYRGDGRSDILRRQTTTGAVDMLLVDGTVVLLSQGLVVTVADPNWQIVRTP